LKSAVVNKCIWLQLLRGWKEKLNFSDGPLPQDLFEGVDPDEWVCIKLRVLDKRYFIVS